MHYVESFDRSQMMMTTWDSMVDPESTARLIDAFVDSLDLSEYGVKELAPEGRPPYCVNSIHLCLLIVYTASSKTRKPNCYFSPPIFL